MTNPTPIRALIGCEESATVREALRARGVDAWSCDILPSRIPGNHIQGNVLDFLGPCQQNEYRGWDIGIFFPPCTYTCVSGLHWNGRVPGRAEKTEEALAFDCALLNAPIKHIALENPVGCISTRITFDETGGYVVMPKPETKEQERANKKRGLKPSQIIQPYNFGEDASKATCLWLKNLPPLQHTRYVEPRMVCKSCKGVSPYEAAFSTHGCAHCGAEGGMLQPRWANQTDSGQNRLGPSEDRGMIRSVTYSGIAEAMASQWTAYLTSGQEFTRTQPTLFP